MSTPLCVRSRAACACVRVTRVRALAALVTRAILGRAQRSLLLLFFCFAFMRPWPLLLAFGLERCLEGTAVVALLL